MIKRLNTLTFSIDCMQFICIPYIPIVAGAGSTCLCDGHFIEIDHCFSGDAQSAPAYGDQTTEDEHRQNETFPVSVSSQRTEKCLFDRLLLKS